VISRKLSFCSSRDVATATSFCWPYPHSRASAPQLSFGDIRHVAVGTVREVVHGGRWTQAVVVHGGQLMQVGRDCDKVPLQLGALNNTIRDATLTCTQKLT